MSKEYILIEHNPTELTSERNLYPKQITLTEEEIGLIMYGLFFRETKGLPDLGNSLLLDKLKGLIGENI